MPESLTEVVRIEAGTKMVQLDNGTWEAVPDDDPRAADTRWHLMYPLLIVNGVHQQPLRMSHSLYDASGWVDF